MSSLLRFQGDEAPELGCLVDGEILGLGWGDDRWAEALKALEAGELRRLAGGARRPVGEVVLLPPITETARVFCVAQNFPAHAAEAGGASPPRPIVFMKPPSAFVGHGEAARLPEQSQFFDYEGEIAAVVGSECSHVAPESALGVIAGYTIGNDGSARDLQPATLADRFQVDWFAAKSFDRASALGPTVVSKHAVPPVEELRITTTHNGEPVQDDLGSSMFHSVPALISFISSIVSLRPGDVILTGTPAGVGKARGVALADGDEVVVAVSALGELRTTYRRG